jgi:protein SCO1/2
MNRVAGALLGLQVMAALFCGAAWARSMPIEWSLSGMDGRPVSVADLPRKWLLVYFGYAYCPDICPTALADLARVLHDLGERAAEVQPIFITIDPARDTPDVLAQYVAEFDPRILALTGSETAIAAAAQQFHVHYVRYKDAQVKDYSFDHTSALFLVNPSRILVGDFATPDLPTEEIVAALRQRLDAADRAPTQATINKEGFHDWTSDPP